MTHVVKRSAQRLVILTEAARG